LEITPITDSSPEIPIVQDTARHLLLSGLGRTPSILTAIFHMLRDGTFYNNLGADFFQTGTPHLKPESSPKKSASWASTAPLPRNQLLARKLYADKSTSVAEICKMLGISRHTLQRYVKEQVTIG